MSKGNECGDDPTKEAQLRSMEQSRMERMEERRRKAGPSRDEW